MELSTFWSMQIEQFSLRFALAAASAMLIVCDSICRMELRDVFCAYISLVACRLVKLSPCLRWLADVIPLNRVMSFRRGNGGGGRLSEYHSRLILRLLSSRQFLFRGGRLIRQLMFFFIIGLLLLCYYSCISMYLGQWDVSLDPI